MKVCSTELRKAVQKIGHHLRNKWKGVRYIQSTTLADETVILSKTLAGNFQSISNAWKNCNINLPCQQLRHILCIQTSVNFKFSQITNMTFLEFSERYWWYNRRFVQLEYKELKNKDFSCHDKHTLRDGS